MTQDPVSGKTTLMILFAGIVAISTGSILIRFADDVHPVMIATYRLSISMLILIPLFKFKGKRFRQFSGREWVLCSLSGMFLALHFVTFISALQLTTVANSVVLVTMNPLFVGILSAVLLKDRVHRALILGIVLSVAGSIVMTLGTGSSQTDHIPAANPLLGNLLALTGAMMTSFYMIIGSRVRKTRDLLSYITVVYSIAALFLIIVSIFMSIPFTGYKGTSVIAMILLAVLPQMVGHTSFNWALRHLKSSMVAVTAMGEPVGATLLAYVIFKEALAPLQFAGIVMILAAIFIASKRGRTQDKRKVVSEER